MIAATLLLAPSAHAQFSIDWYTIDGGVSTSSSFTIMSSIGQPLTGTSTGGPWTIQGDFWPGVLVVPEAAELGNMNCDGVVNVGAASTVSLVPMQAGTGFVLHLATRDHRNRAAD